MANVIPELIELLKGEGKAALATVVSRAGSAPGPLGSRMVVRTDQSTIGTVGGGCMEASVWQAAAEALERGRWIIENYTLTSRDAATSGMICGGMVGILVEPLSADEAAVFQAASELEAKRERGALVTVLEKAAADDDIESGHATGSGKTESGCVISRAVVKYSREPVGRPGTAGQPQEEAGIRVVAGTLDPPALAAAEAALPRMRSSVELTSFPEAGRLLLLQTLGPPSRLVIFGAGHLALELAHLAKRVHFEVAVIDDRTLFASPDRFPDVDDLIVGEYDDVFPELQIDQDSYLVIMTPGHFWDEDVLEQALGTGAAYIGMIGSRTKVRKVFDSLRSKGVSDEMLGRVHAPIGLDIGARSPEEIAVSIAAELIRERSRLRAGG